MIRKCLRAPFFYRLLRRRDLKINRRSSSFEPIKNSIANHMDSCSVAFCQPVQQQQQQQRKRNSRSNWDSLVVRPKKLTRSRRLFRIFMEYMYVKQPSRTLIKPYAVLSFLPFIWTVLETSDYDGFIVRRLRNSFLSRSALKRALRLNAQLIFHGLFKWSPEEPTRRNRSQRGCVHREATSEGEGETKPLRCCTVHGVSPCTSINNFIIEFKRINDVNRATSHHGALAALLCAVPHNDRNFDA